MSTFILPGIILNGERIPDHLLLHEEDPADHEEVEVSRIVKKADPGFNIDDSRQPFVCGNSSMIPPDPKKTYGHFTRKIIVQSESGNTVPVLNHH